MVRYYCQQSPMLSVGCAMSVPESDTAKMEVVASRFDRVSSRP